MNRIIRLLKDIRKQSYLKLHYQNKYAFVGIGSHSINNLYPILHYLRVPLKYIVVSGKKNAALIENHFAGVEGTYDFQKVLSDPEIRGVIICANPTSHFELIKKSLEHNKHVFVEKPPCSNAEELLELIHFERAKKGFCMVGMQRRYAPLIDVLKKSNLNNIISYNYRFMVGAYPEGDMILDVFIHPLDLISYLFGECSAASVQVVHNGTYLIHLLHNGFVGSVELSTHYTWRNAEEELTINTFTGLYKMKNMNSLTFEKKPHLILSIPLEKIRKSDECVQILYNGNQFSPILENNQLFSAGYFNELKTFIDICEGRNRKNKSPLSDMVATFKLIHSLKSIETH